MHGQRKQDQREATLQAFRTGRIRALVATDVLGRGVDIPDVTHVVIYDFPQDIETYIHRVGRTGRNGKSGKSIAFYESKPWLPDLARELMNVLQACEQEIPKSLEYEAGPADEQFESWGGFGSWNNSQPQDTEMWKVENSFRKAPALESDSPGLATVEELGEWHADGASVWGYSANGGRTEQGRLELRSGGKLRTTWGWGEWALLPSAPHCPPPSRRPPTAAGQEPASPAKPDPADMGAGDAAAAAEWSSKPKPGARHLSLSWGGCTDVVALNDDGLSFELVSRSGRPASTFKSKTMGKALPGVSL
jgi:superfamily II DNA/RNA helicase